MLCNKYMDEILFILTLAVLETYIQDKCIIHIIVFLLGTPAVLARRQNQLQSYSMPLRSLPGLRDCVFLQGLSPPTPGGLPSRLLEIVDDYDLLD